MTELRKPSFGDRLKAKGDKIISKVFAEEIALPQEEGGKVVLHPRFDLYFTSDWRDVPEFRPVLTRPSDVIHLYDLDGNLTFRSRAGDLEIPPHLRRENLGKFDYMMALKEGTAELDETEENEVGLEDELVGEGVISSLEETVTQHAGEIESNADTNERSDF